jgi:hypothetical protein
MRYWVYCPYNKTPPHHARIHRKRTSSQTTHSHHSRGIHQVYSSDPWLSSLITSSSSSASLQFPSRKGSHRNHHLQPTHLYSCHSLSIIKLTVMRSLQQIVVSDYLHLLYSDFRSYYHQLIPYSSNTPWSPKVVFLAPNFLFILPRNLL